MLITLFVPMQIVAAEGNSATAAVDTSWYNSGAASGTVFELADAADLRGAARLSQQGVTFSGYTLKLTANIDLNPGWDAEIKVENGKAVIGVNFGKAVYRKGENLINFTVVKVANAFKTALHNFLIAIGTFGNSVHVFVVEIAADTRVFLIIFDN